MRKQKQSNENEGGGCISKIRGIMYSPHILQIRDVNYKNQYLSLCTLLSWYVTDQDFQICHDNCIYA